jgi:LPXTG-motif cell wall-anchored protein
MIQNKKYLLRKIGKRVCHVALAVGTLVPMAVTSVSADEVTTTEVQPTTEAVAETTTSEATTQATTEATTQASSETTAETTVESTRVAETTAETTAETPTTEWSPYASETGEKRTKIDDIVKPNKNETSKITIDAQVYRYTSTLDHTEIELGGKLETTEIVRKENADAEILAMIREIASDTYKDDSGLEVDGKKYRVESMMVNKLVKEENGQRIYNYTINFLAREDVGLPHEPVIESTLKVTDQTGKTLIDQVRTGTQDEPAKFLDHWMAYNVGEIVQIEGKTYQVEFSEQNIVTESDIDSAVGTAKTYLTARVREVTPVPSEYNIFRFVDESGNVIRDNVQTELSAGKAESVFLKGDKVTEAGKNYTVVDRSTKAVKDEAPEGTHTDVIYTIVLKEAELKKVTTIKVVDTKGNVIKDTYKVGEGEPGMDIYVGTEDVDIDGTLYTIVRTSSEVVRTQDNGDDVETMAHTVVVQPKTIVAVDEVKYEYNVNTEYELNGKVVKVDATATMNASTKAQADKGLDSESTKAQAKVGEIVTVDGTAYKVTAVKEVIREAFEEDNGLTRMNAKVVLTLELVDSQEEPALVDTTTTTQTSEAPKDEPGKVETPKQETPKEEAPKQDVPQKEAPKKEVPAKAELPNTGAESMVGSILAGLSSLVAGLGTLVSKKRQ